MLVVSSPMMTSHSSSLSFKYTLMNKWFAIFKDARALEFLFNNIIQECLEANDRTQVCGYPIT